jgi:hypothetical protein
MSLPSDFSHVYAGLKDFQRDTVEHVAERFYGASPVQRFLVADEVGLGKTLVATGTVAKTIEHHLAKGTKRIDIIYICSNGDIARQNTKRLVNRLAVPGLEDVRPIDRMTLLPKVARELDRQPINVVALTPGTSFNLRSSEGRQDERRLLYALLWQCWDQASLRGNPALRVFAGWAEFERFAQKARHELHDLELDPALTKSFASALQHRDREARREGQPSLHEEFEDLRGFFHGNRKSENRPAEHLDRRRTFIGELRALLARTCINALKPELVILDEFQRFKGLLDGTDPASDLAHVLFDYPNVRTLLLSATPYKMFTVAGEPDEDHYADLVRTLRFLGGDEAAEGFAEQLHVFRRGLMSATAVGDLVEVRAARDAIEAALRSVMVRTERLASTPNRSGMLTHVRDRPPALSADDVRSFVGLERASRQIDAGPVLEYWKDTAYPLNFMEDYKLSSIFHDAVDGAPRDSELITLLERHGVLLNWDEVEAYRRLDPANARLRALAADVVDSGAWQLAWLAPSMPYYRLRAPWDDALLEGFTKRLIFSAWRVVPKVIASMLSYEAERRMMTRGGRRARNTPEDHARFRPLLQTSRSRDRLTGMPVFALLYPSPVLARLGDPLQVARQLGATEPLEAQQVLSEVERRLEEALQPLMPDVPSDGPVDERWYWAAPLLLDGRDDVDGENTEWWGHGDLPSQWRTQDEEEDTSASDGWTAHVDHARAVAMSADIDLGRVPTDLAGVLAQLAVGGPAVTALRALSRTHDEVNLHAPEVRDWAAYVAWGFRSLFNQPEITTYLRGSATASAEEAPDSYWRLVLRYCVDGCLQAVLDEFVHILPESLGVGSASVAVVLEDVGKAIRSSLSIRNASYGVDEVDVSEPVVRLKRHHLRGRFALRFGDERGEEERSAQRQGDIRAAFNSPFWPFVLATTSVGQEGLDFHQYCHAVVHWNLPSNPVDLEQREGRVHRYKGHAVRKNVASAHRQAALGDHRDPWAAMFADAASQREAHLSEVIPYWVYTIPGGATIERHVPALPLSRDAARLETLSRSLAVYRLVFGQPRQDDLLAYLQSRFTEEEIHQLFDDLRIDLSPLKVT